MATTAIERLYKLTVDANQATRQLTSIKKSTQNIESGFDGIRRAATAAFAVFASFKSVQSFVDAANQIDLLEASFAALTDSAERGTDLMQKVFATVDETGANFEDVATSIQRLTIGMQDLGATNVQIDAVAEAFIKIGRIGGTSMFSINQALVQFTQGLASGRLQGDELRSILERVPLITSLIAKEMGVTRGEIKELGRQGKVTADIMVNALLKALPQIRQDFETLPIIAEQSVNRILAQWLLLQKQLSDDFGIASGLVTGLENINDAMKEFAPQLKIFVDDLKEAVVQNEKLGYTLIGLAAIVSGALTAAFLKFSKSNPFTALTLVAANAALAIIASWEQVKAWFNNALPAVLDTGISYWYRFLDDINVVMDDMTFTIVSGFQDTINSVIDTYSSFQTSISGTSLGRVLGLVGVPEQIDLLQDMTRYTGEWGDAAADAASRAAFGFAEYEKEMGRINAVTKETVKGQEELNEVMRAGADATAQVDDYNKYLEKLNQNLEKLRDSADPLRRLNKEIAQLQEYLARDLIDEEEFAKLATYFTDAFAAAQDTGKELESLFDNLIDAVNGFAKEFTDTIVDGLIEGELAFDDFAEHVLETLAKILLNDIFTQFFSTITGAITGTFAPGTAAFSAPAANSMSTAAATPSTVSSGVYASTSSYGLSKPAGLSTGVNVNVVNNTPAEVTVSESQNDRGVTLDIIIEEKVNQAIAGGGLDRTMQSSYGLSRRAF